MYINFDRSPHIAGLGPRVVIEKNDNDRAHAHFALSYCIFASGIFQFRYIFESVTYLREFDISMNKFRYIFEKVTCFLTRI